MGLWQTWPPCSLDRQPQKAFCLKSMGQLWARRIILGLSTAYSRISEHPVPKSQAQPSSAHATACTIRAQSCTATRAPAPHCCSGSL